MACLCVLLGGPSYAAGADSLTIAGQTYDEPGVSGTGWAWTDADHLQLNGYADEAIGAEGDLVVTLVGQNVVDDAQAEDADMCTSGLEVWGNLTLCGAGSLRATGSQCGVFALGALVIDGCLVDGRADGRGMIDASVAGVRGATVSVRGGAHVVAAGSGSGDDCHFLGMYASDGQFAVDASWVDATGAKAGVACESGSLTSALFVTPMGGAFGSTSVIDANGKTISSSNYTVSYATERKNVGRYKVTVTFKGDKYSGSKYTYFYINPKGTSISKVSGAKKAFTVKWKKQSSKMATSTITGYQIRYSTSSKMTSAKTKTVKGYKYTSKKITKLSAKKKYYVQVRTYKTVSGKTYYSSWSSVKSVKTK